MMVSFFVFSLFCFILQYCLLSISLCSLYSQTPVLGWWVQPEVVFCSQSPSAWSYWCVLHSEMLFWSPWLYNLYWLFTDYLQYRILPIGLNQSAGSPHQRGLPAQRIISNWMFFCTGLHLFVYAAWWKKNKDFARFKVLKYTKKEAGSFVFPYTYITTG